MDLSLPAAESYADSENTSSGPAQSNSHKQPRKDTIPRYDGENPRNDERDECNDERDECKGELERVGSLRKLCSQASIHDHDAYALGSWKSGFAWDVELPDA